MSLKKYLRERAEKLRILAEADPKKREELLRIAADLEKLAKDETVADEE